MNCEIVQRTLVGCDYGSKTLSLSAACQAHLETCPQCHEYAHEVLLRNALTEVSRTDFPSLQLEKRVLNAASSNTSTSSAAVVWMMSAAASIFLIAAIGFFIVSKTPVANITQVQLAVAEIKPIRFMLSSNNVLSDATINIALSDNIALDGFPDLRKLSWKTNIRQGDNMLVLPVQLLKPTDGTIELVLEHEGATKTYIIQVLPNPVAVAQPAVSI